MAPAHALMISVNKVFWPERPRRQEPDPSSAPPAMAAGGAEEGLQAAMAAGGAEEPIQTFM